MDCDHNCSECNRALFCQEIQHTYFDKRFNKLTKVMIGLMVIDLVEFIALILGR